MLRFIRILIAAAVLAAGGRAASGEPPQTQPVAEDAVADSQPADEAAPASPFDLTTGERLTGDWGGARPWLEERGITLTLGMTNTFQQNAHGGVRTHNAHRVTGSYDLDLTLDTEALKLWPGGTLYAYADGGWGRGVSDLGYVGDLFGVNWDAVEPEEVQLSELWYGHSLLDGKVRVRLGKLYPPTDFDNNALANDGTTQFLNSALVNAANIPFPDYGHGFQLMIAPVEWFYVNAAVIDAEADGGRTGFDTAYHGRDDFFSICEVGLAPTLPAPWGPLPGGYRFGLWYDPQPKERFCDDLGGRLPAAPLKRDDLGFYISCDQMVWMERAESEDDEQGAGVFVRYAHAPADANPIENFWSVGGQYRGLLPTRDDDVLGFGVAQGVLSKRLRLTGADPHRETALELYYNIQLLPWLAFTPDLQWILRPGGENGRDAFVAGARLQMTF